LSTPVFPVSRPYSLRRGGVPHLGTEFAFSRACAHDVVKGSGRMLAAPAPTTNRRVILFRLIADAGISIHRHRWQAQVPRMRPTLR
jgi:hypothetical protein